MAVIKALDIIKGAFRKLGINEANAELTAEEAQDGLTALNDMCNAWDAKNIFTGFSSLATTDDEFPLEERHHAGVKAMLAEYIAPDYGVDLAPEVKRQAYDGMLLLMADYHHQETLRLDAALQFMPSQRRTRAASINGNTLK